MDVVTPLDWGQQELLLVVSAIYKVNGRDGEGAVKTFEHTIQVQVTHWQRATEFWRANWQWVWAAAVVPVGAWLWTRLRRRTADEST